MNPIEALAAVRAAVVGALTLGAPKVDIIGIDGVGESYLGTECTSVLRIEWSSFEPAEVTTGVSGLGGCLDSWTVSGVVMMFRCWESFSKTAGFSTGAPQTPAQAQAASSLLTLEAAAVATALRQIATVSVVEAIPPSGNRAGWSIRFEYTEDP